MKHFWTFYQRIEAVEHPFQVFGIAHFAYIAITVLTIVLCFRKYKSCGQEQKLKWQRGFAWYFFIQEMLFYLWIYVQCQENVVFEVLQLELCTFCLFMNFSTLFHNSKQVRFFGALMGMIGGPIAMIYPATVAEIYPAFSYRLINFYMTHGAYIFFSLMLLSDRSLMNQKRLIRNMGIAGGLLIAVYFFDLRFGTQYMFVGTPPEIGIIRMVYDLVGGVLFLPVAVLIFSGAQALFYKLVKALQQKVYGGVSGTQTFITSKVQ